jgi:hypothetical protein
MYKFSDLETWTTTAQQTSGFFQHVHCVVQLSVHLLFKLIFTGGCLLILILPARLSWGL